MKILIQASLNQFFINKGFRAEKLMQHLHLWTEVYDFSQVYRFKQFFNTVQDLQRLRCNFGLLFDEAHREQGSILYRSFLWYILWLAFCILLWFLWFRQIGGGWALLGAGQHFMFEFRHAAKQQSSYQLFSTNSLSYLFTNPLPLIFPQHKISSNIFCCQQNFKTFIAILPCLPIHSSAFSRTSLFLTHSYHIFVPQISLFISYLFSIPHSIYLTTLYLEYLQVAPYFNHSSTFLTNDFVSFQNSYPTQNTFYAITLHNKKEFIQNKMEMPDDTPTKPRRSAEDENQQQFEATEQNFSSFDSNSRHLEASSSSIDEDGFKNMQIYRQKQLAFPEVPSNLAKLYQIYIHNVTRKQELKKAIQVLIQKQIKALRIAFDKDNFFIEEMIDLDQQSTQFKQSRKNYEERKAELQKLARHYRQLKIMHVEGMMVLDPIMKNTLDTYTNKNKEIIHLNVTQDTVSALCKEKYKPRKIRKPKNKKGTKKNISNNKEQELEDELLNTLEKGVRSRNTSQTVSSQEEDQKTYSKFIFRNFKFFKTQHGVSFQPFQQLLELPADKEYRGFIVEPNSKNYIVYEEKKMHILNSNQKQLKIKSSLSYDQKIIFCETLKNLLYVGTADGLMWVYDIREGCHLVLHKIVLCNYGNDEQITHFALTNNPDIVIFVKKGVDLCEMNLGSYSGYLLSHLQEPIQFIDSRLILTKSCVYLDYYASGGSHGKAILQHHDKLKKASKNRRIIKYYKHNDTQYAIFDEGSGVFSVQNFSELSKK